MNRKLKYDSAQPGSLKITYNKIREAILLHGQAYSLSFLLLVALPAISFAQDIATANLTWTAEEATDLSTGKNIAYRCQIKTDGAQSVKWLQKNGQMITTYTVTGTEGNWSNISSLGSFTYQLSRNGKSCKMIVEKKVTGTFITMDFSKQGEYVSRQRFRIKSVTNN